MEILDICDELGNPTGKTVEREIAHQQGILHRTAHVWILRKKKIKYKYYYKKKWTKDSFPGCYDISSAGHIPAGDNYGQSAVRELKEELGIVVRKVNWLIVEIVDFILKKFFMVVYLKIIK